MLSLHLFRPALLFTLVCLLLWAPSASARQVNAPPGNAGVQEYVELVPDSRGGRLGIDLYNRSVTALRSPGSLSQAARDRLSGAGRDGEAAAALAEAGSGGSARRSGEGGDGRSPAATAARRLGAADGPGGMGLALPLLLALLLAAALAYELRRRRADS